MNQVLRSAHRSFEAEFQLSVHPLSQLEINALDPRERSTFEHGLDGMASCDMAFDRASVQPVPIIEHVHGPAFYEVTRVRTDTYSRVLGGERHLLCVLECSV